MKFICVQCSTELQSPHDRHCSERYSLYDKRRKQNNMGQLLYHANVSLQVTTVAEHYINVVKEYPINYQLQTANIPNGAMFQQLPKNGRRHLTLLLQTEDTTFD